MTTSSNFYSQDMRGVILLGMEEVLGREGEAAILHLTSQDDLAHSKPSASLERAVSFDSLSSLQVALEQVYGVQGGRGVAFQIGRACFKYAMRSYGTILGVTGNLFRLMPFHAKLRSGSQSLVDFLNQNTDQFVRLEETETHLFWHVDHCPICLNLKTEEVSCYLVVGFLQEALYWLSGKVFQVTEIACCAKGDAFCTFSITKAPLA